MGNRSVADLIVGAARGEPLSVEERERLDAALARDPALRRELDAQHALGAELAALRRALEAVPLPADDRCVAVAYRRAQASRAARRRSRRRHAGAGAAVIAAAGLAVWLAEDRTSVPEPASLTTAPAADATGSETAAVFHALPGAPDLTAEGSYSVVRVRIPVWNAAATLAVPEGQAVEADLLIGADGLVRAIRFDGADALYVAGEPPRTGAVR